MLPAVPERFSIAQVAPRALEDEHDERREANANRGVHGSIR
jgi:hypothetical protein